MKKISLLLIGLLVAPAGFAAGTSGNLMASVGQKTMENAWGEFDKQAAATFSFDIRGSEWPINFVIEQNGSAQYDEVDNEDLVAVTAETSVGIRTYFNQEKANVVPFIGAGVSYIYASEERLDIDGDVIDDDDQGNGYWVGAGILWKVSGPFAIGASVRYSTGDVNLFGRELDAGGVQAMVTARVWQW